MDANKGNSTLDNELVNDENIPLSDSFITFKIDESYGNIKCDLNLKKNAIDETRMPVSLRGKQWSLKQAIGEGTNFKTYLATSNTGETFAIRKNRKQDRSTDVYEDDEKAQEEIANTVKLQVELDLEMMKLIGEHPNITGLVGFRQVGLCWEQFMEYVDGGSLFDYMNENYIKENRLLEVEKAQSFFSNLLSAVEHIHKLKIAHMDIKLENCLLTKNGTVKLTDFDEARYFILNLEFPYPTYYTLSYAAPETFTKRYKANCADIWACGIFLYFLLQQRFPWNVANSKKDPVFRKWSKMGKNLPSTFPKCYGSVSDLLIKILKVKVEERATLVEIRNHDWLQNCTKSRKKVAPGLAIL